MKVCVSTALQPLESCWKSAAGPIVSTLSDWHHRVELGESEDNGAKEGHGGWMEAREK